MGTKRGNGQPPAVTNGNSLPVSCYSPLNLFETVRSVA